MSSEQPVWSAPAWMKTAACVVGMLPMVVMPVVLALNPSNYFGWLALTAYQSVFYVCFVTLITSKPPRAAITATIDFIRARAKSKCISFPPKTSTGELAATNKEQKWQAL